MSSPKKSATDPATAATVVVSSKSTDGDKSNKDKNSLPSLGALEEDDEFEEFVAEEWNEQVDSNDQNLWEDNWDDDDIEDDFSKQLRAELDRPQPMKL